MTVPPPYHAIREPCQSPSGAKPSWPRTWRRNPNYRHGRWCRYRGRLEYRLARAQRRVISYVSQAPRFAPFCQRTDWTPLPVGLLPRRLWAAAVDYCRQARVIASWWRAWLDRLRAGLDAARPIPVLAFLGHLFRGIGGDP